MLQIVTGDPSAIAVKQREPFLKPFSAASQQHSYLISTSIYIRYHIYIYIYIRAHTYIYGITYQNCIMPVHICVFICYSDFPKTL